MPRILLIAPKFDSDYSRARELSNTPPIDDAPQSFMAPLHLATIAALTPPDFEVDIWDEGARGDIDESTDLGKDYQLVGVTAYIAHIPRAIELAHLFHKRGLPVVIGGPGVSGSPEMCRGVFDTIFLGEAELTWPRFLRDWQLGQQRAEYRQVERPNLNDSPAPIWGSVAGDVARYRIAGVQTTRGCPYDCEFCDVIHLFGRQPRHKPIARVIEEIVALQKLGVRRVFICDDDFIGDKRYAKEFLRELIPVNNAFDPPMSYSTQLTVDLAQDEELMELMSDANFSMVFVGLETPREASLKETHKVQNLRVDLVQSVRKIQSYGIAVKAALIVGFDSDDVAVFDEQIHFIDDAQIPVTSINVMKAYPGTPLWVRLQRDNRVLDVTDMYSSAPKVVCNIIPKGMSRVELLEGYLRLLRHARSWPSFTQRIKGFISGISRQPKVSPPSVNARKERMAKMMQAQALIATLPELARNAITEIIMHTMQTAPYMIEHVSGLVAQHAMDAFVLPYHADLIQRQIDQCNEGKLKLAPDPSAGMIPKHFKPALRESMPMLWERLNAGIGNGPGIAEALVGVAKDFLIRWGPTFEKLEDYHAVYLNELCDRHIGRYHERQADDPAGYSSGRPLDRTRAQSSEFLNSLLVAVEQEMRGDARSRLDPDSIGLKLHGERALMSA
jgi:radical SAM superfamily enzyme YgiQ (UPF0313 family)